MKKTNIGELAKKLRISRRRIYALVEEGVLPKAVDGEYDIKECGICYMCYLYRTNKEFRLQCQREWMAEDILAGRPMMWTIELAAAEMDVSERHLSEGLKRTGAYYRPAYRAEVQDDT